MPKEFSVALRDSLNQELKRFLLREEGQEDLAFALWNPSYGAQRITALLHTAIWPGDGDRIQHGNVAFMPQYFERVCKIAMKEGCGIAFMHSHIGPGWQSMSEDDTQAEAGIAGSVESLTDLPLVGLTLGTDGTWSARFWTHTGGKNFKRHWCRNVRVVGEQLSVFYANEVVPKPKLRELFKRTVAVWGEKNYNTLARLRVGIVGLGSVGSLVVEILARMGFKYVTLIDFDEIQPHNLDRLTIATAEDVHKLKVDIAKSKIERIATAENIAVERVPFSVVEEDGYRAALDCDVIFSCVDRPRPRKILNHLAYAHLIPIIDGGIAVRFKNGEFSGADWQLQTVAPGRVCLECLRAFTSDDAWTEEAGKMDDPSYLQGLPQNHHFKRNENVIPFAANLASLEVLHLIALVTGAAGQADFGVQRFRWIPGIMDSNILRNCEKYCDIDSLVARGDRDFVLFGKDPAAEAARRRQSKSKSVFIRLIPKIYVLEFLRKGSR
ncbi:MAG TPA: ThiF family adenylyltransferase [Candidatus Paceibacterota bacterium]